jgi:hypothetical protein
MAESNEKTSWPELEGVNVDQAVETIKAENPALTVLKNVEGGMITYDYRIERVRVFYNPQTNLVSGTPRVG